jgi:hypothetical protein
LQVSLLVLDPAVAGELGLNSEQSAAIQKLIGRLNHDLERSLQLLSQRIDGPAVLEQAAVLIDRSRRETDERIMAQIGTAKARRLKQIQRQLGGISMLVDSPQADGLRLSTEQQSRFKQSLEHIDREVEVFRRRKEREALEAVLRPDQQAKLADQLGKPVEFSLVLPWIPSFRSAPIPQGAPGMPRFEAQGTLPPVDEPIDLQPIGPTP